MILTDSLDRWDQGSLAKTKPEGGSRDSEMLGPLALQRNMEQETEVP